MQNKSWKTTLTGAVLAGITIAIPLLQNGTVSLKEIGIAAFIAAFGYVSKDFDVTGGKREQ